MELNLGATEELSLRVSVAALARVLFEHPVDGKLMLALERRVISYPTQAVPSIQIKSHPFGGALRIHDLTPLQNLIRDFRFDSETSHAEKDFRLFIRPRAWEPVKRFCMQQFAKADGSVLESDPWRELEEEFAEVLKIKLSPAQFRYRLAGTVIEDQPSPTENIRARGYPTARIYRIFEARVLDPSLASALISNSESDSDDPLNHHAFENVPDEERFNTLLTLPYQLLKSFYSTISAEMRNTPVSFQNHLLDETVAAVLDSDVPKYRRV